MTAESAEQPFDRAGWFFEWKFDGVRALLYADGGLRIVNRSGNDITARYPELQSYRPRKNGVVLDGEIVALDKNGHPDFQELQKRINLDRTSSIERLQKEQRIHFYVFDILASEGKEIHRLPLHERKELLKKTIGTSNPRIEAVSYAVRNGKALFEATKKLGLEGVMAKNACSVYEERRSKEWLKIKHTQTADAIVVGYTRPKNARECFGSLVLGMYDNRGNLHYAGHVGSGFSVAELRRIEEELLRIRIARSPLISVPGDCDVVSWTEPKLVCEVKFSNWSKEHHLRHPSYICLRSDKTPEMCLK